MYIQVKTSIQDATGVGSCLDTSENLDALLSLRFVTLHFSVRHSMGLFLTYIYIRYICIYVAVSQLRM